MLHDFALVKRMAAERMPARFLGAEMRADMMINQDAIAVHVVGMGDPIIVSCMELYERQLRVPAVGAKTGG